MTGSATLVVSVTAAVLQVAGLVLILGGLYRRSPSFQRKVRAARQRVTKPVRRLRRFLGLSDPPATAEAHGTLIRLGLSAEGRVPPTQRKPEASLEERLDWLEQTMDLTLKDLRREEEKRAHGDRELTERLADLDRRNTDEHTALRDAVDEVSVPETAEVWGSGLVLVGLIGHIIALILG